MPTQHWNPRKVGVLGSGVMGSQIACLFASANVPVILLDLPAPDGKELPAKKGLQKALNTKPSPIHLPEYAELIETGDFEKDIHRLQEVDWVIEAIIEDINAKKSLLNKISNFVKPNTIISTNTSSIPIKLLSEALPPHLKKQFLGTHFFNPPRYLPLLELIPGPTTDPSIIKHLIDWTTKRLGRTCLVCKDTPAFIANRIGVYAIALVFKLMEELDLSIADVDALTGPVVGRPKSATFRTVDLVGLDTLLNVMEFLSNALPQEKDIFKPPEYLRTLVKNNSLGEKTGKGFYFREYKDGKRVIYMYDWKNNTYVPRQRSPFQSLMLAENKQTLTDRIITLLNGNDKASEFTRRFFASFLSYTASKVPEITDEFYQIDDAMEAGFGWELGPFRLWDAVGFQTFYSLLQQYNEPIPTWIEALAQNPSPSFYRWQKGQLQYYTTKGNYEEVESVKGLILLHALPEKQKILDSTSTTLYDLGDNVLSLIIHTRMNTIGEDVLYGINKALDTAEKKGCALIITSAGDNFSAGANLALILQLAVDGEWEELDMAVRLFQNTNLRIKYAEVPVIVAPFGLTLGGGAEICLHAPAVVAERETYIGLVETGVGLIPAGGGTKEMALRASRSFYKGDPEYPNLLRWFMPVAQAKVAESAD